MLYLAPSLLQSIRINFTTLELSWQPSQGATQYRLIQTYTNGTLIYSNDFGNINSTIVDNLEPYVQYIFTIYPSNFVYVNLDIKEMVSIAQVFLF